MSTSLTAGDARAQMIHAALPDGWRCEREFHELLRGIARVPDGRNDQLSALLLSLQVAGAVEVRSVTRENGTVDREFRRAAELPKPADPREQLARRTAELAALEREQSDQEAAARERTSERHRAPFLAEERRRWAELNQDTNGARLAGLEDRLAQLERLLKEKEPALVGSE